MNRLLLALALIVGAACRGDDPTPPARVTATYYLETVNSAPLPYRLQEASVERPEITLVGETITLFSNRTFAEATHVTYGEDHSFVVTWTSGGTYRVDGARIEFDYYENSHRGRVNRAGMKDGNMLSLLGAPAYVFRIRR